MPQAFLNKMSLCLFVGYETGLDFIPKRKAPAPTGSRTSVDQRICSHLAHSAIPAHRFTCDCTNVRSLLTEGKIKGSQPSELCTHLEHHS